MCSLGREGDGFCNASGGFENQTNDVVRSGSQEIHGEMRSNDSFFRNALLELFMNTELPPEDDLESVGERTATSSSPTTEMVGEESVDVTNGPCQILNHIEHSEFQRENDSEDAISSKDDQSENNLKTMSASSNGCSPHKAASTDEHVDHQRLISENSLKSPSPLPETEVSSEGNQEGDETTSLSETHEKPFESFDNAERQDSASAIPSGTSEVVADPLSVSTIDVSSHHDTNIASSQDVIAETRDSSKDLSSSVDTQGGCSDLSDVSPINASNSKEGNPFCFVEVSPESRPFSSGLDVNSQLPDNGTEFPEDQNENNSTAMPGESDEDDFMSSLLEPQCSIKVEEQDFIPLNESPRPGFRIKVRDDLMPPEAKQEVNFQSSGESSNAVIKFANGHSLSYVDEKLPAGWKRLATQRCSGKFVERFDVYYSVLLENGRSKKFRSRVEIQNFLDMCNIRHITSMDFEFNGRNLTLPTRELQAVYEEQRQAGQEKKRLLMKAEEAHYKSDAPQITGIDIFKVEESVAVGQQRADHDQRQQLRQQVEQINCTVLDERGKSRLQDVSVPPGWEKVIQKAVNEVGQEHFIVHYTPPQKNLKIFNHSQLAEYLEISKDSSVNPSDFDFSPEVKHPPPSDVSVEATLTSLGHRPVHESKFSGYTHAPTSDAQPKANDPRQSTSQISSSAEPSPQPLRVKSINDLLSDSSKRSNTNHGRQIQAGWPHGQQRFSFVAGPPFRLGEFPPVMTQLALVQTLFGRMPEGSSGMGVTQSAAGSAIETQLGHLGVRPQKRTIQSTDNGIHETMSKPDLSISRPPPLKRRPSPAATGCTPPPSVPACKIILEDFISNRQNARAPTRQRGNLKVITDDGSVFEIYDPSIPDGWRKDVTLSRHDSQKTRTVYWSPNGSAACSLKELLKCLGESLLTTDLSCFEFNPTPTVSQFSELIFQQPESCSRPADVSAVATTSSHSFHHDPKAADISWRPQSEKENDILAEIQMEVQKLQQPKFSHNYSKEKCPMCSLSFDDKVSLTNHIYASHQYL